MAYENESEGAIWHIEIQVIPIPVVLFVSGKNFINDHRFLNVVENRNMKLDMPKQNEAKETYKFTILSGMFGYFVWCKSVW